MFVNMDRIASFPSALRHRCLGWPERTAVVLIGVAHDGTSMPSVFLVAARVAFGSGTPGPVTTTVVRTAPREARCAPWLLSLRRT